MADDSLSNMKKLRMKHYADYINVAGLKNKYPNPDEMLQAHEFLYDSEQVYRRITEMISDATSGNEYQAKVHAQWLNDMLQSEFTMYGMDTVLQAMAKMPEEVVYLAEQVIYDSDNERSLSNLYNLQALIRGVIPTTDEAKEWDFGYEDVVQDEDYATFSEKYTSGRYQADNDNAEWIKLSKGMLKDIPFKVTK